MSLPFPPIMVSLPAPPLSLSLPSPPLSMSLPAPPFNVSLPPSPLIVSLPAMPSKLSPPWPPENTSSNGLAVLASKSTSVSCPVLASPKRTTSMALSTSVSPVIVFVTRTEVSASRANTYSDLSPESTATSWPSPPLRVSLPIPPTSVSLPVVAVRVFPPLLPRITGTELDMLLASLLSANCPFWSAMTPR